MAIQLYNSNYKKLPLKQLLKWNSIPTAVISDSMNRQNVMASRISALLPGKMVGQARTVSVIAGDNGAIHASMNLLGSNDVLVIDGGAYKERALWGGILNTLAIQRNISGVVIDGAIRDIDELIGNASKAKKELDWKPKCTFKELVKMMIEHDMDFFKSKIDPFKNQ